MIIHNPLVLLIVALLSQLAMCLDHEKSYFIQDAASSVLRIGFYKDSLLIPSANDVVQKDIETGAFQRTFRVHTNQVETFAVIRNSTLITAGWDDLIAIWDLDTGSIIRRIRLRETDTFIKSLSIVGDQLYCGGLDSQIRQFSLADGRLIRQIAAYGIVYGIAVEGEFVYVGMEGLQLQAMKQHLPTGEIVFNFEGHSNSVFALLLKGTSLFTASADTTIICWSTDDGTIIRTYFGHSDYVYSLTIFENDLYTGGRDRKIIRWNLEDAQIVKQFPFFSRGVIWAVEYRDHMLYSGATDGVALNWNLTSYLPDHFFAGRPLRLRSLAVWKNYIISGGDDTLIKLWDASINSVMPSTVIADHRGEVNCLSVSLDSLFSAGSDSIIRQWNLTDFSLAKNFIGHTKAVYNLEVAQFSMFSSDLTNIIIGWNLTSAVPETYLQGHTDAIKALKLGNDVLFSCSFDYNIRIWNLKTLETTQTYSVLKPFFDLLVLNDDIFAGTDNGLVKFSLVSNDLLVQIAENVICTCLSFDGRLLYSGHEDSVIRGRDLLALSVVQSFQGHADSIVRIRFDETNIMYSLSFDGSIKRWNMITRRVAFSFENRNSSVSFLAAEGSLLFVGLQNGAINGFNIKDATIFKTTMYHENAVSGITAAGDVLYSSGLDGRLVKSLPLASFEASNVYNSNDLPINSMALYDDIFLLLTGDFEILLLPQNASIKATKKIVSQTPINCITVADDYILAGARSGSVFAWDIESLEPAFELKGHTSQVNNILADYDILYSASDDKSIIQWSLFDQTLLKTLRRTSASAIGHLGPVNLLSMCNGVLFSAGSDTTTRRWNTESGRNEDVYFGFSKPVTSVLCYNGSVFAGSEDFSVLMFNPRLPDKPPPRPSRSRTTEKSRIPGKTRFVLRPNRNIPGESNPTQLTLVLIVSMAVVLFLVGACFFYCGSKRKSTTSPALTADALESTATATDLATVVNSVMGISKHGAFLIPGSTVARLKKIATGGGGELFLAKLMDPIPIKNSNQTVIQKVVFMGSKNIEEAFYQEVGIMIMLSSFPHFCKIIAYTENPLSMILQYYPDGSLYEWLIKNRTAKILIYVKVAKDIAEALNTMHSHYLAHCDLKPQNVLVQIVHGIPSCFLTDFGITQILSDAILAAKTFRVSTLGGLSIHYAAPEAFQKFRKKEVKGVDHTKFDIYSFGCILYELVARRSPWK